MQCKHSLSHVLKASTSFPLIATLCTLPRPSLLTLTLTLTLTLLHPGTRHPMPTLRRRHSLLPSRRHLHHLPAVLSLIPIRSLPTARASHETLLRLKALMAARMLHHVRTRSRTGSEPIRRSSMSVLWVLRHVRHSVRRHWRKMLLSAMVWRRVATGRGSLHHHLPAHLRLGWEPRAARESRTHGCHCSARKSVSTEVE